MSTKNKVRECLLIVASALKGTGKSYTSFWKTTMPYYKGQLNSGVPRKVLIIDVNDEYGIMKPSKGDKWANEISGGKPVIIKALDPKDIKAFTAQKAIEIRRIRPILYRDFKNEKGKVIRRGGESMGEVELLTLLKKALYEFRGGLLVIEDLASSVGTSLPKSLFSEITRNRHRDNDILTHVQSIAPILPKFWQNINIVRMHHQTDDVEKSAGKLLGDTPLYKIAQILVDKRYAEGYRRQDKGLMSYFVYVNHDAKKINGNFSKEEFMSAIYNYIDQRPYSLNTLKYMTDQTGKSMFNHSTARSKKAQELFEAYYGN